MSTAYTFIMWVTAKSMWNRNALCLSLIVLIATYNSTFILFHFRSIGWVTDHPELLNVNTVSPEGVLIVSLDIAEDETSRKVSRHVMSDMKPKRFGMIANRFVKQFHVCFHFVCECTHSDHVCTRVQPLVTVVLCSFPCRKEYCVQKSCSRGRRQQWST